MVLPCRTVSWRRLRHSALLRCSALRVMASLALQGSRQYMTTSQSVLALDRIPQTGHGQLTGLWSRQLRQAALCLGQVPGSLM